MRVVNGSRSATTSFHDISSVWYKRASAIRADLMISPRPEIRSRRSSPRRMFGSMTTRSGCATTPIRFLPRVWLRPVLPPIDESTAASSVVGTEMKRTPRKYVAATNPIASPIVPRRRQRSSNAGRVPRAATCRTAARRCASDFRRSSAASCNCRRRVAVVLQTRARFASSVFASRRSPMTATREPCVAPVRRTRSRRRRHG